MPFFLNDARKQYLKNTASVTLQVRPASKACKQSGKRVWLSASLTIEGALALSLLVFASVIMLIPMKMMDVQRRVQAGMEACGEELSQMVYLLHIRKDPGEKPSPGLAQELAAEAYTYAKVMRHVEMKEISSVSFRRSRILEDGETICLVMDYEITLPFSVFRINRFPMQTVTYKRAWVGKKGKLGEEEVGGEEEVMVYVGKGSTRFHWSDGCHYLENQLVSCKKEEVGAMRNEYGGKYSPCGVCGASKAAGDVFIFSGGSSYHSSQDCTSITAYVRQVPLSEAAYLGACSYCSQNKT